jgi:predicted HicB family RNase H-like nuclease
MARTSNGDEEDKADSYRLSITIDPSQRKKFRIAAAVADKSIGEWAAGVLERAADKAVPKLPTVRET